jgi:hypothetical protein
MNNAKQRRLVLFMFAALTQSASAQSWSPLLDPSRAIDWTSAGFTVPSYTTSCATQPSLKANDTSAAAANAAAIQNALASCDATHNVVNIPAGVYYATGINYGPQGRQVLRGAGPGSTSLVFTDGNVCTGGFTTGLCMVDSDNRYNGSVEVLPPGGTQQCLWTAGYAQGATTLTLSNCPGGPPPVNQLLIIDQANDLADNGGVLVCDNNVPGCAYESGNGGNNNGRFINGVTHSEQEITRVTDVTSLGGGSYAVSISPGVFFSNIRASQSPGAWWPGMVQNDGLENLTLDGAALNSTVGMDDCYQCWVQNVRFLHGGRNHIALFDSAQDVIRSNYFYGAQGSYSQSYCVEYDTASGVLVENNIFQQVTLPTMFGSATGNVVAYNFSILSTYTCGGSCPTYVQQAYVAHNAGNNFNLFEGNDFLGIAADDAWGTSSQDTYFRNMLYGWQSGRSDNTIPVVLRDNNRAFNIVGNVLGQPGYHSGYQTYSSSGSTIVGGPESLSSYSLGLAMQDGCAAGDVVTCDPLVASTLMRWGNWDVASNATQWNAAEASPAAVPYVNANFNASHFSSLAHALPSSLYASAAPSWWSPGAAWPPVGPDVSSGNVGVCRGGTYDGAQATSASQCAGGTLAAAWASHVNANPALDCFLNVMHGAPDGTGSALSFDAALCYGARGTPPASPTGLVARVL